MKSQTQAESDTKQSQLDRKRRNEDKASFDRLFSLLDLSFSSSSLFHRKPQIHFLVYLDCQEKHKFHSSNPQQPFLHCYYFSVTSASKGRKNSQEPRNGTEWEFPSMGNCPPRIIFTSVPLKQQLG